MVVPSVERLQGWQVGDIQRGEVVFAYLQGLQVWQASKQQRVDVVSPQTKQNEVLQVADVY